MNLNSRRTRHDERDPVGSASPPSAPRGTIGELSAHPKDRARPLHRYPWRGRGRSVSHQSGEGPGIRRRGSTESATPGHLGRPARHSDVSV